MLDPEEYPLACDYLGRLPAGLESYPNAQTKLVVIDPLCTVLREHGYIQLPGILGHLVRGEHEGSWMPDVCASTLALMVRDRVFSDDDQLTHFTDQYMSEVFHRPLYRVLFAVMSPSLAMMGAAQRWGTFRTGSSLRSLGPRAHGGKKVGSLVLEFPPNLYMSLNLQVFAAGFRAALRATRANDPSVEVAESTPTSAAFRCEWT